MHIGLVCKIVIFKKYSVFLPEDLFNHKKQCTPWLNAALCGISSGTSLFFNVLDLGFLVYKEVLSHDVASGSDNTQCYKIDKPLVVYRLARNVMTSIVIYLMSVYYRNLTCFNRWQLYVSYKFSVSQCDKSLSAGFNPIKTWQQRAAMPLQPAKGHRLQVKIYRRSYFMEKWPNYFNYHKIRSFIISDRRQSKTLWTIDGRG